MDCIGCKENILNQEGHMDPISGCIRNRKYYLYVDGAGIGIVRGSAILFDENMNKIASKFAYFDRSETSEYKAIILGVELCTEKSVSTVDVILRLYSELTVNQLKGESKIDEKILPFYNKISCYDFFAIEHVGR